ncbi:DNA polymerase III subunit delta' [filamentous cyanobacterium CCP5]|nr:DNA polymerase III subunit delta' [filamentous cyanobacterium CCP5]
MVQALFDDLVGQEMAIDLLVRSHQQHRLAPAYLFAGPEGIGRRLAAERFAELMLMSSQLAAPGLRRRIVQRNHPDLLWVEPTYLYQGRPITPTEAIDLGVKRKSPPQIRLSQVRDISRFLSRPPLESPRSVVIIEAAETMAEGAANGLLKTLEEPGNATLILLAPGSHRLLPTLVSRCQMVPFTRLGQLEMETVLQRLGRSDLLSQPELLSLAQGSPGRALEASKQQEQIPPDLLKDLVDLSPTLEAALRQGRNIAKALDIESQLWLADYLQHVYWQRDQNCDSLLQALEQAKRYLRSYCQPRLVWEVTLMACQSRQP